MRPVLSLSFVHILFGLAILFLIGIGAVWGCVGAFAKNAFPINDVWEILGHSLFGAGIGAEALWRVARVEQNKLSDTTPDQLEAHGISHKEASRLSQLDSKYWLLIKIIESLSGSTSGKELQVEAAIETLRRKRSYFASDLSLLKRKFYPELNRTQRIIKRTTTSKTERDNEKIERILNILIKDFASDFNKQSRQSVRKMLDEFQKVLENNSENIDVSRLKSLYKFWYLIDWVSRVEDSDGKQLIQGGFYRAWNPNGVYHFNKNCKYYPDRVNPDEMEKILCYETREEAEQKHRACDTCSNRSSEKARSPIT